MKAGLAHPSAAGEQQIPRGLKPTRDDNLLGVGSLAPNRYIDYAKLSSRAQRGICFSFAALIPVFLIAGCANQKSAKTSAPPAPPTITAPASLTPWNKVSQAKASA